MNSLSDVRNKIDELDKTVIDLLVKRFDLAKQVASIKNSQAQTPLTDQSRENRIFEKIDNQVVDVVYQDIIKNIYPHLFQASKTIRTLGGSKTIPFKNVGIIGDGLIGRSIYKITKAKSPAQVSIKNRDWKIEDFKNCDLIILASPISAIVDIARTIANGHSQLKKDLAVIDVASVKSLIASEFAKLNELNINIHFVPTHPMGGGQVMGKNAAKSTLFADRPWVVCSDTDLDISMDLIQKVCDFAKFCGSAPIVIDSKTHDELVTYISHVPGLISKTIHDFVSKKRPEALKLAGSGYEMMTKIGKSNNVRMRNQISNSNKENIEKVLKEFASELNGKESGIW